MFGALAACPIQQNPQQGVGSLQGNPLLALKSPEQEHDFKQNHRSGRTFLQPGLTIFGDFLLVFRASRAGTGRPPRKHAGNDDLGFISNDLGHIPGPPASAASLGLFGRLWAMG